MGWGWEGLGWVRGGSGGLGWLGGGRGGLIVRHDAAQEGTPRRGTEQKFISCSSWQHLHIRTDPHSCAMTHIMPHLDPARAIGKTDIVFEDVCAIDFFAPTLPKQNLELHSAIRVRGLGVHRHSDMRIEPMANLLAV